METHKKQDKTLTYESDGKMGNRKKESTNKKRDFFNTTQNSE